MQYTFVAASIAATLLAGCVTDDGEDFDVSESAQPLIAANKLAANKLAANKLAANKLAANKLAATSLQSQQLMATADGREVMSFIVGCALPQGQNITLKDPAGVSYIYPGWLNLAPAWVTRVPTVTERRWVTACLLARTNLYGTSVDISMRSKWLPALATTPTEVSTFKQPEGAFYGDLFATTPVWYACATKTWTTAGVGTFRVCALSQNGTTTECGFTYTGDCAKGPACNEKSAPFNSCLGAGQVYTEVVTIFLK